MGAFKVADPEIVVEQIIYPSGPGGWLMWFGDVVGSIFWTYFIPAILLTLIIGVIYYFAFYKKKEDALEVIAKQTIKTAIINKPPSPRCQKLFCAYRPSFKPIHRRLEKLTGSGDVDSSLISDLKKYADNEKNFKSGQFYGKIIGFTANNNQATAKGIYHKANKNIGVDEKDQADKMIKKVGPLIYSIVYDAKVSRFKTQRKILMVTSDQMEEGFGPDGKITVFGYGTEPAFGMDDNFEVLTGSPEMMFVVLSHIDSIFGTDALMDRMKSEKEKLQEASSSNFMMQVFRDVLKRILPGGEVKNVK